MTTTSYYYTVDEQGVEHTIDEPGELCNFCGDLSTISKKGTLLAVSMPSPLLEEYGHSSDLHAHKQCLMDAIREYDKLVSVWKKNLKEIK